MARYDKYDPYTSGFRAPVAVDFPDADLGKIFGVGINSSGQVVKGAGQTGIIGVLVVTQKPGRVGPLKEVRVVDILREGCITDFGPSDGTNVPGVNYGVAGTMYYSDLNGVITSNQFANSAQQVIIGSPSAGTFTLTYNSQTTATIAYNGGASAVASALNALSSIGTGGVTVTGLGTAASPFIVQFSGSTFVGNDSILSLTGSGASLTGGSFSIVNSVQSTFVGHTVEPDRLEVDVTPLVVAVNGNLV